MAAILSSLQQAATSLLRGWWAPARGTGGPVIGGAMLVASVIGSGLGGE
jgi:hypothetical protein